MTVGLSELVQLSHRYGADPRWVLAGGGNTSYKDRTRLWIKASGTTLATIDAEGFVGIDRAPLGRILSRNYPTDHAERERLVLADLLAARIPGAEKRPSVETLLHDLFPHSYVVHTHPALINGMTCGATGSHVARELFGDEPVWIGQIEPGYLLATATGDALQAYRESTGTDAHLLFLENHGVVIAGDEPEQVVRAHEKVASRCLDHVRGVLGREPDLGIPEPSPERDSRAAGIARALRDRFPAMHVRFASNRELLTFLDSPESAVPLLGAYTPDHIVYSGASPLYVMLNAPSDSTGSADEVVAAVAEREAGGSPPRCVLVQDTGLFSVCPGERAAQAAEALMIDALQIAFYAQAFGGHRFLRPDLVEFILGWEVERFRASIHEGHQ